MAMSQGNSITWSDIRNLFDRVNAERNRWGKTTITPSTYIGKAAGEKTINAETPNKLKTLIQEMASISFLSSIASTSNISTVEPGQLIKTNPLTGLSEIVSNIENTNIRLSTGTSNRFSSFGFCSTFGTGFSPVFAGTFGTGFSPVFAGTFGSGCSKTFLTNTLFCFGSSFGFAGYSRAYEFCASGFFASGFCASGFGTRFGTFRSNFSFARGTFNSRFGTRFNFRRTTTCRSGFFSPVFKGTFGSGFSGFNSACFVGFFSSCFSGYFAGCFGTFHSGSFCNSFTYCATYCGTFSNSSSCSFQFDGSFGSRFTNNTAYGFRFTDNRSFGSRFTENNSFGSRFTENNSFGSGCPSAFFSSYIYSFSNFNTSFCPAGFCPSGFYAASYFNTL